MDWAENIVKQINDSPDKKYIIYRESRPIADLKQMITESAELYSDRPAFQQRFHKGQPFGTVSYGKALADMNAIGTALIDMGLKNKRVAVIGANCYQWAISYLAVVNGVGIVVPLDKELNTLELSQLCQNAGVEAVIFDAKHESDFLEINKKLGGQLKVLINMNGSSEAEEFADSVPMAAGVLSLADVRAKGQFLLSQGDRAYLDAEIDPEAMSILLFTSGTTGIAKGVMLSHKNICCDLMISPSILKVNPEDIFFSVLPLHHTYECTSGFLIPLYKGASIAYCEGLKYIQKNLKEVEPTMFLGVPLIFEKLYNGIWATIRKQGKEDKVRTIMNTCKKLGKPGLQLQKKLLKDIYALFGSRMRMIISGGAAIKPEVLEFFNDLGYAAVQGYGLTECAPMVALNPDKHSTMRNASVGHLFPAMQAEILDADENGIGEICVKGDNIMLGYYNMPEETAAVLTDGWFHTGDLGYLDKNDFIYITGRKKNVIIAANGKNVFPEELEYYLSKIPYVEECMVWAASDENGQDTIIQASIYPDKQKVSEAGGGIFSLDFAKEVIQREVNKLNEDLPIFKQIRRVIVRGDEFEKTTGQKIKRFVMRNKE